MKIQSRIVLPYSALILVFGLLLGGLSVHLAHQAVAERVSGNLERTVELLAGSGFPLGAGALEKVGRLLHAQLATFDAEGKLLDASLSSELLPSLQTWLDTGARAGEVELAGTRWSAFSAPIPPRPDGLAGLLLLRPSVELEGAASEPLLPMVAALVAGLLLAVLIGRGIGVGLARPIRDLARRAEQIGRSGEVVSAEGDELALLQAAFDRMLARLEQARQAEKLAALGKLVAAVAHEVRNPLTSIRMTLQLAADAPLDAESRRIILDEVERLNLYTSELLFFVRPPQPEVRALDVERLLHDVVTLARPQLEHRGLALDLHVEPVGKIMADPNQLKQVFWNLVSNAVDCQNEGGAIRLELRREDGSMLFACQDRGPGLDPALRGKLFQAFAARKDSGTGLGLWICQRVAEAHGGSIRSVDMPVGARFELRLPAGDDRRAPHGR